MAAEAEGRPSAACQAQARTGALDRVTLAVARLDAGRLVVAGQLHRQHLAAALLVRARDARRELVALAAQLVAQRGRGAVGDAKRDAHALRAAEHLHGVPAAGAPALCD